MGLRFVKLMGISLFSVFFGGLQVNAKPVQVPHDQVTEVFVSSSRQVSSAFRSQGSWSKLDSDSLELLQAIHIQQALQQLPGVNFHRNNGQEYLPSIRSPVLTGAGACGSFLMAEDSIPLRPAGFCNVNELFEAHHEQAESIEVARGPGITLYGSNAMHGVVNVLNPARVGARNMLAVDAGPYDRGRIKTHLSSDQFAAAITLSHDGGYRHDAGVDQQKFSARYETESGLYRVAAGLTATNLNQNTAGFAVGEDVYKDESLARINPDPEAFRDARSVRTWWRLDSDDAPQRWSITPYARASDMTFLQHFLPGTPLEKNGQRSVGVQSGYTYSFADSSLLAGIDIEYAEGYLQQTQAADVPPSFPTAPTRPAGINYDYEVAVWQLSPYLRLEQQLTPALTLMAGLRFESMRYDYDNLALDGRTRDDGTACVNGCVYNRPADSKDTFDNWSPSVALTWQLSGNHAIQFVAAQGFRAPQTGELYRLQRDQTLADLDSEELRSLELNIKGNFSRLQYELATYWMDKENVIYRDSSFFNVGDGETRHRGVEARAQLALSSNLQLQLVANYADHQYDYHRVLSGVDIYGNTIDTAPRWFGSAQIVWAASEAWRLQLEWQHMGSYYLDPENLHSYDGHDVVNGYSQWQVSDNLSVGLNLLNVFDEEYANRADYSSFGAGEYRYFPGEPRAIYGSVSWHWR